MYIFKLTLRRIIKTPICLLFILVIPIVYTFLISFTKSDGEFAISVYAKIAVVNRDGGILARALENQIKLSYNVLEAEEQEIKDMLIEQKANVALIIPEGFTETIMAGGIPETECLALEISETPELVKATARSIINSLRVIAAGGTDGLEERISEWEKSSGVTVDIENAEDYSLTMTWVGLYSFLVLFSAFFVTKPLLGDRLSGMYGRIGTAPVSPKKYMAQSLLAFSVPICLQVVLALLAFKYLIGFYMPNIGFMLLAGIMLALMYVGLNVMVCSVSNSIEMATYMLIPLGTVFNMLGGIYWPREYMPEFMQKFSYICPPFWFVNAMNNIETVNSDYWVSILFLAGITLLFLLFGSWKKLQARQI